MVIPDSVETRSSSMGAEEGQPSVSRRAEAGEGAVHQEEVKPQQQAGGVQDVEGKPVEIESVDSSRAGGGAGSTRNDVDTNLNEAAEAGTSSIISSKDIISDAGPSSPKGGTAGRGDMGIGIDDEDANYRLDEGRTSGAEGRGGARSEANLLEEGDPPRQQQQQGEKNPSSVDGDKPEAAARAEAAAAADTQFRPPPGAFIMPMGFPSTTDKSSEHLIDIPFRMGSKAEELDSYKRFGIPRTLSNFSRASVESAAGDQCRICQQHTEEPLMELGCQCRGELAKAHRSCVDHWFGNKGTNKCEVCQHVATNVPLPSSQPTPHFWVWRVGGPYNAAPRRGGVRPYRLNPLSMRPILLMTLRRHPIILLLWLILFAFMAYLFVDVTDSTSIGYAAMPIGFLFGVLVVLGLGTAARLVLECWHERTIRRNIQRMEEEPNFEDFGPDPNNDMSIALERVEGQTSPNGPSPSPGHAEQQGAAEASVTASVAATAAPDVENR